MVHGPKKVGHPLAENQTWLAPRQKQTSHEGWVAGKIIELIFQPTTFDYKRVYRIASEMANEPGLTKRLETEAFVSGQSPIFLRVLVCEIKREILQNHVTYVSLENGDTM